MRTYFAKFYNYMFCMNNMIMAWAMLYKQTGD